MSSMIEYSVHCLLPKHPMAYPCIMEVAHYFNVKESYEKHFTFVHDIFLDLVT